MQKSKVSNIIDINDYQPQFSIETDGKVSVIPVSVFREIATGKRDADCLPNYIIRKVFSDFIENNKGE